MPSLQRPQGLLHYADAGRGPTVVLLHGFCETIFVWEEWQEDLLEEGYRVLRIDLPGFGGSSGGVVGMDALAAEVVALTEHLKIEQAVCIGHSLGGYVALALARQQPDWLIGLGLFHSHPYPDNEAQRVARQEAIEFIRANGHIHYVKQLIPRLFAPDAGTSVSFRRDMLVLRASRSESEDLVATIGAMAQRADCSDVLAAFSHPVLFINGAKDPVYTEAQRQDQLALPARAEVLLLEHAGHMGMLEEKRLTQRAVRYFAEWCFAPPSET